MIQFLKDWMIVSLCIAAGISVVVACAVIAAVIFTGLWKLGGIVGIVIGFIFAIGFLTALVARQ